MRSFSSSGVPASVTLEGWELFIVQRRCHHQPANKTTMRAAARASRRPARQKEFLLRRKEEGGCGVRLLGLAMPHESYGGCSGWKSGFSIWSYGSSRGMECIGKGHLCWVQQDLSSECEKELSHAPSHAWLHITVQLIS